MRDAIAVNNEPAIETDCCDSDPLFTLYYILTPPSLQLSTQHLYRLQRQLTTRYLRSAAVVLLGNVDEISTLSAVAGIP